MKTFFKRVIAVLCAASLVCGNAALLSNAASYSGQCGPNLTWSLNTNSGTLMIIGKGAMYHYGDFFNTEAPWFSHRDSIKTLSLDSGVTSIGESAFENCTNLSSVTFPNSLLYIEDSAFEGCENLVSALLPGNLLRIGSWSFSNCTNLKSLRLPDSVRDIGYSAFYNCNDLVSVTIPNGLIRLESCVFESCSSLSNVSIPASVTEIYDSAFLGCHNLTKVNIPSSVKRIGNHAFRHCTSLTSITIPDSITSIGEFAFSNTSFYNDERNWTNGVLYIGHHLIESNKSISGEYSIRDGTKCIADHAFESCTELTNIVIPNSVTSIGEESFLFCNNLDSITIPYGVTSIGYQAFAFCSDLANITILDSVRQIGQDAFYDTAYYNNKTYWKDEVLYIGHHLIRVDSNTSTYSIREGTCCIADSAFNGCRNLSNVNIPFGVKSIGNNAFRDCEQLSSLTIPNSVADIGQNAFYLCRSLSALSIPNSMTRIGDYAFYYCVGLINVIIPDSVTSIGESAFESCGLKNVTIPNSVTSIGESAFDCCTDLEAISIPGSVKFIGGSAFSECYKLKQVTIPNGVTEILPSTFWGCASFTNVTIPDGVVSIGAQAFDNCTNLVSLHIPRSTQSIDSYAFDGVNDKFYICSPSLDCYAKSYADVCGIAFQLCGEQPVDSSKYMVNVQAKDKTGALVAVPNAYVTIYDNSRGQSKLLYSVTTDASGKAAFSVEGLTKNQLKNLTVSAYLNDNTGSNISGDERNALFNQFGLTENGEPIRFIYQLHSEKIDANGNWVGEKLPESNKETITLTLSEPRLLVNLAVSYLKDSKTPNYEQRIMDSMNFASQLMAQATDGHVMFNKILLVPTSKRSDFANTSNIPSMADIQIQATLSEGQQKQKQIWSNAYVHGFYSDMSMSFDTDCFENIGTTAFQGKEGFLRVQLSGLEGAGWDYPVGTEAYATTICHELGHYLLGFYDEYMDGNHTTWYDRGYYPYPEQFGLMDNQHYDIELSRNRRDYAYLNNNFQSDLSNETYHAYEYAESCENSLRDLLTDGNTYEANIGYYFGIEGTYSFSSGRYKAKYTLAPNKNKDRTAEYECAVLDESAFIRASNTKATSVSAQSDYLSGLVKDGNCYYYVSDSEYTIGYVCSTDNISATISSGKATDINGTYSAVSEYTQVTTASGGTITGEFYGMINCNTPIDYSSLAWFCYANGSWKKINSSVTRDAESLAYGVRCDYVGDGKYVIMAKSRSSASRDAIVISRTENSTEKDALVDIFVQEPTYSRDIDEFKLYYSDSPFSNYSESLQVQTVCFGQPSYSLLLAGREKEYYVSIQAVCTDGSKSDFSEPIKIITGTADSDQDGVPDWYCDKYLLWGIDENKNIAASDENGNGISNLDEYLAGNDPTFVEEETASSRVAIHNYQANRTVDYKTTITFSTDPVQNPVSGAQVHWFIDGQDKGASDTYTEKEARKNFTVQAKYIKNGTVLAESETETVKVNAGFFARLKAFFRKLFKKLPVVVQEYLGVDIIDRILP